MGMDSPGRLDMVDHQIIAEVVQTFEGNHKKYQLQTTVNASTNHPVRKTHGSALCGPLQLYQNPPRAVHQ